MTSKKPQPDINQIFAAIPQDADVDNDRNRTAVKWAIDTTVEREGVVAELIWAFQEQIRQTGGRPNSTDVDKLKKAINQLRDSHGIEFTRDHAQLNNMSDRANHNSPHGKQECSFTPRLEKRMGVVPITFTSNSEGHTLTPSHLKATTFAELMSAEMPRLDETRTNLSELLASREHDNYDSSHEIIRRRKHFANWVVAYLTALVTSRATNTWRRMEGNEGSRRLVVSRIQEVAELQELRTAVFAATELISDGTQQDRARPIIEGMEMIKNLYARQVAQ